jgi:hypothetical protein
MNVTVKTLLVSFYATQCIFRSKMEIEPTNPIQRD